MNDLIMKKENFLSWTFVNYSEKPITDNLRISFTCSLILLKIDILQIQPKERFLRETLITIDTLCAVVWFLLSFIVQYHLKINACTFSISDSIFISCTCKVWVWEQYQSSFDLHAYRQNKQNIYYRKKKDFSPIKYTIFKLKSKILLINW